MSRQHKGLFSIEVEKIEYVDQSRAGEVITGEDPEEIAKIIYERFIQGQK